jgi:FAD synthase
MSNISVLTLRLPFELKHKIELMARKQGVSINQLAMYAFTKEMMEMETADYFTKYWNKKSKKQIFDGFDKVLKKIKKSKSPDWDKID